MDDSASSVDGGGDKKFEKFGYSRNEVWNWLYTDDGGGGKEGHIYSVPSKGSKSSKTSVILESPQEEDEDEIAKEEEEERNEDDEKKGEVEFSPQEFTLLQRVLSTSTSKALNPLSPTHLKKLWGSERKGSLFTEARAGQ
ncbi:Putative LOC100883784 [Caligus rogercresseyi]|uniref:LOC100883784 n=1 Tax=Caligus rogercresseyi TaxID=217165 RepID=A0A7T8QSD6_CALRO|nr:Putative LOC100883784 [Caligus rogercresseyi]